jgi:Sec7-like guanine-nucleotide exchange factor
MFSEKYYVDNKDSGEIKSDKAARALAFSVMLLNTDAHNSQVANKMTLKQFFRNNQVRKKRFFFKL